MLPVARPLSAARLLAALLVALCGTLGGVWPAAGPARAAVAPSPWPPSFGALAAYPASRGAYRLAPGDFDGDGAGDLATINPDSSTLSVLLGDGRGAFRRVETATTRQWPYGSYPMSLAVADFDGDGRADVATSSRDALILFRGRGDGTLASGTVIPFGALGEVSLRPVVAADLDGDGRADLAAGSDKDTAVVLLGNGDGTFRAPARYGQGAPAGWVRAVDVDGDGRRDLLALRGEEGTLAVLPGNGDGTFRPAATFSAGAVPFDGVVADVDGDGHADLALVNHGSSAVRILRGNGDGTFDPAATFAGTGGTSTPDAVAAGDVDGDGTVDLVVGDGPAGTIHAIRGHGDGTFGAAVGFPTGAGTWPIAALVEDLDRDGRADLLVVNNGAGAVGVLLGQPPPVRLGVGVGPRCEAGTDCLVTVVARDAAGRVQPGYRGTVRLAGGDPRATLPADHTFTAADNGEARLFITPFAAGWQTVTATDVARPDLAGTGGTTVRPAPAASLHIEAPAAVAAGEEFALTVIPYDRYGNVDTAYHGTARFTSDDADASLPGETSYFEGTGAGMTFRATLRTPGSRQLTVTVITDMSLAGWATIDVAPAAPGPTPEPSPEPTPSPTPSPTPKPSPSSGPSTGPSATPSPTASPSPGPLPSPGGPVPTFADVPADHWAHDQIIRFARRGITTGCGPGEFCPGRPITRAEMAAFLIRTVTGQTAAPPGPATPTFADVSADHPQYGYIEALVRLGTTTGCGGGEYCPDRQVTRAEMAAFIIRARTGQTAAPPVPAVATFADVPVGHPQHGFIEELAQHGITTGCGDPSASPRTYCPNDSVTRAEMAVFIIRAYP